MVAEITNVNVTNIDSDGQVTIPAELREELGLTDGEAVVIERQEECLIIRRATVVERTAGALSAYGKFPPPTIEEMKEAVAQAIAEENARYE
jgi:AbrB family looped-hinge helix DNA binding protein